jgi:hypothetical protein
LVLLVRCQDRSRGLRLQRHESQRKLLDLRLYELILLTVRVGFMKEDIVVVEPARGGAGKGYLKLKFRDVGKWSGRGQQDLMAAEEQGAARSMRSKFGNESSMGGSGGSSEKQNFARISREFDKMRRDRLGDPRDSYAGEGAMLRNKIGSRGGLSGSVGRGSMVNPAGHSRSLAGGGSTKKGGMARQGFAKTSRMGDGHLDFFSDRSAFF